MDLEIFCVEVILETMRVDKICPKHKTHVSKGQEEKKNPVKTQCISHDVSGRHRITYLKDGMVLLSLRWHQVRNYGILVLGSIVVVFPCYHQVEPMIHHISTAFGDELNSRNLRAIYCPLD